MDKSSNNLIIEMCKAGITFPGGAGAFDLDLQVPEGTILGLIGPSGCGKTTLVRLLTGVYLPTAGEVRVFGKPPVEFLPSDREKIGYIPQLFALYPNLSVTENLHFVAGMYGLPIPGRKARIDELLTFVELTEARKRLARQLSGGMQRRLMLAGALIHKPALIFADEPTAGIDPILRQRFWDYFRSLRDQGHTLVVTTQYVGEAAFCDQVAVMRKGRLIAVNTPEGLRREAVGGEMIILRVDRKQVYQVVQFLDEEPNVIDADVVKEDKELVHIYVEDAGKEMPVILNRLKTELDVTPKDADVYLPPFDEIFVRLMQKSEATHA